jgi:hypothetical protein
MRYDSSNMPACKVIDDATGQEIKLVIWVDDVTLEYAAWGGYSTYMPMETITKVSSVKVNHAAREIHVNEPPLATPVNRCLPKFGTASFACGECCQQDTCRRIDYCPAHRCGFGEAKAP